MGRYSVWLRFLLIALMSFCWIAPGFAQIDGGDDGDDDDDNNPGVAGVIVDAGGVLRLKKEIDLTKGLARMRRQQAVASLGRDLAKPSDLRKVSLNRLEQAVARQLASGQQPTEDMLYLAGLTRLEYVFFYPESGDIVIAGPAEGFMLDAVGRPVGIASGRAVLQLDDLIVALRAFGPTGKQTDEVGVSIDPTKDGLARMQQMLQQMGSRAVPGDTQQIVSNLKQSLGLQTVTIRGVSANTHFASVLAEADYRMKLIGIGLEETPVRIKSFVARANPSTVSRNALQRWYFVPDYESVRVTDDGNAIQLVGETVKLVGADELVRADGTRQQTKRSANRASHQFVESFTRMYPQLAAKMPVYAQLRNVIDMLVAAAYIQDQGMYAQAHWSMELFDNESLLPVEVYAAPTQVETAVNAIWKGNVLMTPIGGGVSIKPLKAISAKHIQADEDGQVAEARSQTGVANLADGQWWWD